MAHQINIDEKTGKANIFTVKEPAWHGLGQVVKEALTAEQAIEAAGLGFTVEKKPLYFIDGENKIEIESNKAIVRTDNLRSLGVVGNGYTPVQNKDAFCFFDELVNKEQAIYHTAGVLGAGERVWILAKLPTDIVVGKVDLIENYVLIYNSHDGSSAVTALLTPTRVVCNNTLTAALRGAKNKVTIRHTKNAEDRLKEAHKLLGLSNIYRTELQGALNAMASKKLTTELANGLLGSIFDTYVDGKLVTMNKRIKETVMDIYESSVGGQDMKVCRGTVYGMYNAVTFFNDNVSKYKTEDSRMFSAHFGGAATIRQNAFKNCLALV